MKLLAPSLLAVSLAAVAAVAIAQTSTAPATPNAQPAAVAVTPQTAADANSKAVKRADVATVVRTSPSAADKARDMNANTAGTTNGTDTSTTTPLPARADRN